MYRTSESLAVISQLYREGDMAAQVISTVSDTVSIPATDDMPVRHYILGKSWDWASTPDHTFIESMETFGTALDDAELLYEAK